MASSSSKQAAAALLVPSRTKNLGVLLLNNPRALHALTLEMVDIADRALTEWRKGDPKTTVRVRAILIKSSREGSKRPSFCAGGDVKSVYRRGLELHERQRRESRSAGAAGTDAVSPPPPPIRPEDFFRREYRVNHAIATSAVPVVSLWDGLVIGGGVGLSIHGRYRVATERTRFSMPECRIGLFPDVGSTWWMPRLLPPDRSIARYIALTGRSLEPADLLHTGLATHYVPSDRLGDLEDALAEATTTTTTAAAGDDPVAAVLDSFHEPVPTGDCHLVQHGESIRRAFRAGSVDGIVRNLEDGANGGGGDDDDGGAAVFARSTLATLRELSPTSLRVTFEGLERGSRAASIGDCLGMEFRMARECVRRPGSDFYEGIRSVLIDRDHTPRWSPPALAGVTEESVRAFFAPIGEEEWKLPAPDNDDDDDRQQPSRL